MSQASLFDAEPLATAEGTAERGLVTSGRVLVVEADGGSRGNPGPAGYGALVREGEAVLAERAEYLGECSNNVAEYSGLVAGLRAAAQIDPTAQVEVRMDSRLVVEQMSGRWKIKHADMRRLADEARGILPAGQVTYTWVPRAENGAADALANAVMDSRGAIDRTHAASAEGAGPADGAAGADDGARPASDTDEDWDDEPPIPDVDTNAPSLSDPDAITLVLVSPGWTPRDGEEDPQLTDDGLELAGAAAAVVDSIGFTLWPHLARPSMLLASPLVRAQQTAVLISEVADLGIPTVDDDFAAAAPGESRAELAVRVERAMARLDDTCGGCTIVVAAHADVIAAVIGTVVEAPTEAWDVFRIAPGTISVVRRWSGRGEVHVMGCPAQLVGSEVG
ncbi:histidine phosphatase family protein [Georgenia satyanarayanai]|uniref:histidine phosphatase family protein n=1 Tax=Georgenia satyanarayanai TaxID=860221 RepID=UPI00203BE142|nr:histidine phosphatase family protein [Georgenia satyanarayanai]MCM3659538.1 histidine phosphatase family protein [Georgenia satyanarayanai]